MRFQTRLTLVAFLLVGVAGCPSKDERANITGKVTVAGKGPLTGGNIQFVSVENPNRIGGSVISGDGTYTVIDAPVGECKVVIDTSPLDPNAVKNKDIVGGTTGPGSPPGGGPGKTGPGAKFNPPPKKEPEKIKAAELPAEFGGGGKIAPTKFVKIEDTFSKTEGTPLRVTVERGSNTKDFEVKEAPPEKK